MMVTQDPSWVQRKALEVDMTKVMSAWVTLEAGLRAIMHITEATMTLYLWIQVRGFMFGKGEGIGSRRNIQSTRPKNPTHSNFPIPPNTQTPNHRHRQHQNQHIHHRIPRRMPVPKRRGVDTMTAWDFPVPEVGDGRALEDGARDESDHGEEDGDESQVAEEAEVTRGEEA
jgi:hypothetical protein